MFISLIFEYSRYEHSKAVIYGDLKNVSDLILSIKYVDIAD